MAKRHAFRPNGLDTLEDRVVLSAGVGVRQLAPVAFRVSADQARSVLNAVHAAFARYAGDYQRGLLQAVSAARVVGEGPALTQLARFAAQRETVLEQQLLGISRRLPFGGQNLFPALQADARAMLANLNSSTSLAEAGRFARGDITAGWRAAGTDTLSYIRFINQGGLNP